MDIDRVITWGSHRRVVLVPEAGVVIKKPSRTWGMRANTSEARFWENTRHPILAPTLAVIDEYVNIQRLCIPIAHLDDREFLRVLKEILGEDLSHFGEFTALLTTLNWGVRRVGLSDEPKLQLFDYHEHLAHVIVRDYGQKIYDRFDVEKVMGPEWWKASHI